MFLMNFTTYISTCYAFVPLWFLSSQVCGLKWSYDNFELASGGNDNKVTSGGGTADRCIRLRNTTTNSHSSCIDTGSFTTEHWQRYRSKVSWQKSHPVTLNSTCWSHGLSVCIVVDLCFPFLFFIFLKRSYYFYANQVKV
ncbi:hypothetical protein GW17_00039137 [Ensete ventricosum]|nr:hypothetical protein GW17_00039137 [Ensete ventricosum]